MRSYQQYCSIARALDAVGDRWVLLIVRELLAFGPSRYADLQRGLPGIATNVLAERLRTMEAHGLVERRAAVSPRGTAVYQLTARGRQLDDVLRALTHWALPSMPSGPTPTDAVQPQWSALLAGLTMPSRMPADTEVVLRIESGDGSVRLVLRRDGFVVDRDPGGAADVTLSGPATLVGGLLSGLLDIEEATGLGLRIAGRTEHLAQVLAPDDTDAGATR